MLTAPLYSMLDRAEFVVQLDVFRNSFFGILTLILYQLVRVIILKVPPPCRSIERGAIVASAP
jgi:K+ transporter